jgi:hypothetical protein
MKTTSNVLPKSLGLALTLAISAGSASASQIINLRSGQVGGFPGVAGQPDDIVTWRPGTPGGAPASGSVFGGADFTGANTGAPALVINPASVWTPGISDPLARWINWDGYFVNPDGSPGTGNGVAGSVLYAVPFVVTTSSVTFANIKLEFAVDDYLGDSLFGGPNPDGFYVNGIPTGYSGGNYGSPTIHNQNITAMVNPGLNYLYLYQRDAGFGVSGLIFSARIKVVPAPGALAMVGAGGLLAARRRRR